MKTAEVIVIGDDVPRSRMRAIAHDSGWTRVGITDRGHLVMASEQWNDDVGTAITWVENHTSGVRSVRVEGEPARVQAIAAEIREIVPHEDRASLIEAAQLRGAPGALIRLAGKLAACRPETCDAKHLDAVRRLLSHDNVAVRRAAVRCAYRYPWPEMVALVRERYESDPVLGPQLEHLMSFLRRRDG